MGGHKAIFKLLLKNVENKNPTSNDWWTPLHFAALKRNEEICQLILEEGVDRNQENKCGMKPIDLTDPKSSVYFQLLYPQWVHRRVPNFAKYCMYVCMSLSKVFFFCLKFIFWPIILFYMAKFHWYPSLKRMFRRYFF